MKTLCYILLFLSCTVSAQKLKTNAPEIVLPVITDFMEDGLENGFYSKFHIEENLSAILFVPKNEMNNYVRSDNPYRAASINVSHHPVWIGKIIMVIDEKHRKDFLGTQVIIYHELFHFFGGRHIEKPLLGSAVGTREYNSKNIAGLFHEIKEIPPNHYLKPER